MNPQEKQILKALIVATHGYYNSEIAERVLSMYVADLEDLPLRQVEEAYRWYRRQPKHRQPPLPAAIRDFIQPAQDRDRDDADDGRVTAARILQAVTKFGFYRSAEAKLFMGDLAWEVVEMQGGWQSVCQIEHEQIPIHQAQWRELASAVKRGVRSGRFEQRPALTEPARGGFTQLGDSISLMIPKQEEHK